MKEYPVKFLKGSSLVIGTAINKTLQIFVPKEILSGSTFFSGLNRAGDAMMGIGSNTREGEHKGKQYMVRKSGGIIADTTIGLAFFGLPVTLVTALFADGCKLAAGVLKGAKTDEEEVEDLGEFFEDLSGISDSFMRLFDVPSKEVADDVEDSIEDVIVKLRRQGKLSEPLKRDLLELEGMCKEGAAGSERWCEGVQEKLSDIAEKRLDESDAKIDVENIRIFIRRPTVSHMRGMSKGLLDDFTEKKIELNKSSKQFADDLVNGLENFSKEDFQEKLHSLVLKNLILVDKSQEKASDASYLAYKLTYSLLNTSYKGAALFGGHYKKQLEELIKKEPQVQVRRE